MAIQARHKVLAFYGIPGEDGAEVFRRMTKFTQFSQSKNPIEYSRQYTDEPFQETDILGFSPSIDYAFDKDSSNAVHKDMIAIADEEKLAEEAVRDIILVDTETGNARKRAYSVIPGTEGDNINVYTYSGSMKCKGETVKGTAASSDGWQTVTFTEASGE